MGRYRTYEPGVYDGERVEIRAKAERNALIGKKIGYDLRWSCMMHYGYVTGASGACIEINDSDVDVSDISQVVVLREQ